MAAEDLTTLAKVKSELGDVQTANVDTLLGTLITAASRWIMNQTGRRFYSAEVTWTTDGDGTYGLSLPNGPVTAVALVIIDGIQIDPIITYGDTGWTQVGDRIELVGHRFCSGTANITIRYTSGYSTIPADLDQACVEMACWMFRNRDHFGLQQKSTHDSTAVTYRADVPPFFVTCVVETYQNHFGLALDLGNG